MDMGTSMAVGAALGNPALGAALGSSGGSASWSIWEWLTPVLIGVGFIIVLGIGVIYLT